MSRIQYWFRVALVLLAGVSWVALIVMMWQEYHTLPTAAELADERHVRPPLPFDLYKNIGTSVVEVLFITILLWPGWTRRFILRAIAAVAVLVVWFFATVPMDLNQMEWLHRRWLALMVVAILATCVIYPFLPRGHRIEAES